MLRAGVHPALQPAGPPHRVPLARGAATRRTNLIMLCASCHLRLVHRGYLKRSAVRPASLASSGWEKCCASRISQTTRGS
ncbi:HNH endonuclease [bacterium CPR1]|nr:HNH endonuclease [bacterium CPR1]